MCQRRRFSANDLNAARFSLTSCRMLSASHPRHQSANAVDGAIAYLSALSCSGVFGGGLDRPKPGPHYGDSALNVPLYVPKTQTRA
jgi:hypothetical protein